MIGFALMALLAAPQAAHAQECAGTTVDVPAAAQTSCDGDGVTQVLLDGENADDPAPAITGTIGAGGLELTHRRDDSPAPGAGRSVGTTINGLEFDGTGALVVNVFRDLPDYVDDIGAAGQDSNSARDTNISDGMQQLLNEVDLSGLTGGATINIEENGAWFLTSAQPAQMTATDDVVNIANGGYLTLPVFQASGGSIQEDDSGGVPSGNPPRTRTIDFGDGNDVLNNEGRILVGVEEIQINSRIAVGDYNDTPRTRYYAELRLENLERFENNGEVWLGTSYRGDDPSPINGIVRQGTDRAADDILSLPGTTFVGGPNSRVLLDIDLNSVSGEQDRCDASIRDDNNQLPVADCINLQNGAVEGVTRIAFTDTSAAGRGAYNPDGTVIVDLSDGNGGPGTGAGGQLGAFTFDPATRYYTPEFGGALDNGMFLTSIFYDEAMQQFKVLTVPSAGAHHQSLILNSAQSAWRTANGSFFDRQADLRDTLRREQIGDHGVWLRVAHDASERETEQAFATSAGDIVFDNTHDIDTDSVTLGVDFVRGGDNTRHWVAGGMIGYVRSDTNYQIWTDTAAMNGMLVGAYGSYVNGPLFVDAAVSGIWATLDQDIPQAELFDDRKLQSDVETLGVQIEAGWRFDLGIARVEPLLNASWTQTEIDDFKVPEGDPLKPGNQIMFEDTTSQRVGLGLRGSREFTLQNDMLLGLSLTGRVQEELDGEATVSIGNLNPISPEVKDEFDGTFSELIGGLTLSNRTGRVSGVLNVGSKFGDDYDALSASASFRYQW